MHRSLTPAFNNQLYTSVYHKRIDTQSVNTTAQLVCANIENGRLSFAREPDRRQAFADGIFLLRIPSDMDMTPADQFANQFYRGDAREHGHFKNLDASQFGDGLLGFHRRVDQIEQLLLERRFWATHYPAEITTLGEQMTALSRQIICAALDYSGIPRSVWTQASGSCAYGGGAYHLTFNHYRAQVAEIGVSSHKDDGFLTILRTTQPGLEINRHSHWEKVESSSEYFVIKFGLSMEWLTAHCEFPVAAILHRVTRQSKDRTSYGHFSSSNFIPRDQGIFTYCPLKGLERICDARELIDRNDRELDQGTLYAGERNNESR